jgi:hypothetical protein
LLSSRFERRERRGSGKKTERRWISERRRRHTIARSLHAASFSPTSTSLLSLTRSFSLPLVLSSFPRKTTEDNVDAVVEGGAVRAVVPLLTMFKVDEGRGVSR